MTENGPAIARRRLTAALRRLREGRGLTLTQVAKEMEWSLSKATRIETGSVSVSPSDLRGLLDLYEVVDAADRDYLRQLGRTARETFWGNRYRRLLTPAHYTLISHEQSARTIRHYGPILIPPLLQTGAYLRALIDHDLAVVPMTPDDHTERVALHQERKERVLTGGGPAVELVVDEAALRRTVGGHPVMAAQIQYILDLYDNDCGLNISVLPFPTERYVGMLSAFTILSFDSDEDPDLVFFEMRPEDVVEIRDQAVVANALHHFDLVIQQRLDHEAGRDLLHTVHAEHLGAIT